MYRKGRNLLLAMAEVGGALAELGNFANGFTQEYV
jgi:hypothetical protein